MVNSVFQDIYIYICIVEILFIYSYVCIITKNFLNVTGFSLYLASNLSFNIFTVILDTVHDKGSHQYNRLITQKTKVNKLNQSPIILCRS